MRIPESNRKTALFIVDIQPAFINERNRYIFESIKRLLESKRYDLYIEAVFYAEKGSLWEQQNNWICPKGADTKTVDEIKELLQGKNIYTIEKQTKSVFKGNKNVQNILNKHDIKEVHIIGTETNDCVLATAYEAFDLGFFTYVIEECTETNATPELHKCGLDILRRLRMTNNSVLEKVPLKKI